MDAGGQRARICLARAIYSAAAVAACKEAYQQQQQQKQADAGLASSGGPAAAAGASAAAAAALAAEFEKYELTRLGFAGPRALYLIDDPFSPLDAVTAMAVWQRVFAPGGKQQQQQ